MEAHSILLFIFYLIRIINSKVHETIISGSHNDTGTFHSPETFPRKNYLANGDLYIIILKNKDLGGAVALKFLQYYLHPKSILVIRDSRFGGSLGPVLGRYSDDRKPPDSITSKSCCLRIELTIGCCGPAFPGANGIQASFAFVHTPGRGRREDCSKEKVFTLYCDGECLPPLGDCPIDLSYEHRAGRSHGALFNVIIILATVVMFVVISVVVICAVCCTERCQKWREKREEMKSKDSQDCRKSELVTRFL